MSVESFLPNNVIKGAASSGKVAGFKMHTLHDSTSFTSASSGLSAEYAMPVH
jgi:hypothetical protein